MTDPTELGEGKESYEPKDPAPTANGTVDLHRLLVASVQDYAIFITDRSGRVLTWNTGAERLMGYTREEVLGEHHEIFYPAEDVQRAVPSRELHVAEEEGHYSDEGWRRRKRGSPIWARVTVTALRDDSGILIGFAQVLQDLTERKRAEEALRRSEQQFRLLVQSVQDYGIFMLNPDGHIVSWNEGAERIKGYTREEILGKHFSVFYPEEDLARDKPGMELKVAAREGRLEDEGWRVKNDGSLFWANVVITALRDPAGSLVGFAKVTRDLTDRRAAEQKAVEDARRVAEAEAANRAKSEFLATMSHELRTPLNAIGGYVELLREGIHGSVTEEQADALGRVRTNQQHLLTLINDLLNFSGLEAGRIEYELERVPMTNIVARVEPMIEPQAVGKEIAIEWHTVEDDVVVMADPPRVEQILLNLLTNAVKFTEPGGWIAVRAFLRDGAAAVEVSDSGIGVPPEFTESIFEPFTQVGRSLTSSHESTGLGLAISRQLARAMDGDLTVRSTVGEGSTFTLTLPVAD